jgi:hypothetical protein
LPRLSGIRELIDDAHYLLFMPLGKRVRRLIYMP